MPIIHTEDLSPITQEAFAGIDYTVMGAAFAAHNELGRLFEEYHYADHMAEKLAKHGHNVTREYKVSIKYEDFRKDYYVDLLINNSVPYELKATEELNAKHEAQTLQYLCLCNLNHGKLINFRKPSVESRFISTCLTHEQRLNFTLEETNWSEASERPIKSTLEELLSEWGAYLSLEAYKEALVYFCCSKKLSEEALPLKTTSGHIGEVRLYRIDEDSFLYLTTASKHLEDHKKHLAKVLASTGQKQAQWIHFDKNQVTLRSVRS